MIPAKESTVSIRNSPEVILRPAKGSKTMKIPRTPVFPIFKRLYLLDISSIITIKAIIIKNAGPTGKLSILLSFPNGLSQFLPGKMGMVQ